MDDGGGVGTIAWRLRENRNLILFLALMLLIVMLPAFEHSLTGEFVYAAASILVIVVSVVVNGGSRSLFWVALTLSGPALVLRVLAFLDGYSGLLVWSWGFSAAVLSATMIRLLGDVFAVGNVSRDRLFGCATVYLLIGLLWCYFYAIIEELSPGSFSGLASPKSLRVADLSYFSFNLVTGVALTDVMPVSRMARMVVILQEFASVLYMAFVISRLVGMYAPPAPPANKGQA